MNDRKIDRVDSADVAPGQENTSPKGAGILNRTLFLTNMPIWLALTLIALGLPRTILEDLNLVLPGSSLLYYVLALTPFAIWLAVAVVRKTKKPMMDFVVLGFWYGISLGIVHQAFWSTGTTLGHNPPAAAVSFSENFGPQFRELALRSYTVMIGLLIGLGIGLVVGLVAKITKAVRSKRHESYS